MADLPEDLAKVLAELEARKRSLQNRLQSIETAIQSIHGLQVSYDVPLENSHVTDFVLVDRADEVLATEPQGVESEPVVEVPEREPVGAVYTAVEVPPVAVPGSERRDFILQPDTPGGYVPGGSGPNTSLIEKEKALRRPNPKPPKDSRKAAHLNVYVNKNSDWASRQLVSPKSRRATFRHKTGQRCPKCGSQDTRLSLTKGIADCFMFLFDYSLARCRNCDTKFRIWRAREEVDDAGEQDLESRPSSESSGKTP